MANAMCVDWELAPAAGVLRLSRKGYDRQMTDLMHLGKSCPIDLAIDFDVLICDGTVADQAELARLGHVSRARLTQIMYLLYLAPDIQEAILLLPRVERERDPVAERILGPIVAVMDWAGQRRKWGQFVVGPGFGAQQAKAYGSDNYRA